MEMKTKFAGFGSLLILALVNFPAVAAPSAPCTKEIGEVVPDVGTYVKATADTNYFIKPGECLVSPNKQHMAVLQPDGNFVVYEIHHIDSTSDLWNSGTRDNRKAGLPSSSRMGVSSFIRRTGSKKEPMASLMAIYPGCFRFDCTIRAIGLLFSY